MHYIAYGSNMNLEQMVYRCPGSTVVGVGTLHGWKLVFNVHADIIPTGDDADMTPVVIWNIAPEDWRMPEIFFRVLIQCYGRLGAQNALK